jgi:hypothetical protein
LYFYGRIGISPSPRRSRFILGTLSPWGERLEDFIRFTETDRGVPPVGGGKIGSSEPRLGRHRVKRTCEAAGPQDRGLLFEPGIAWATLPFAVSAGTRHPMRSARRFRRSKGLRFWKPWTPEEGSGFLCVRLPWGENQR